MKKVKYAIIGFGGIAENRIAKEGFGCDKARFNGLPNAELVGVTDMNPAREAAAKALNLKWYKDMDAIFADPEIDAVFVATNNMSHAPIAIKAMNAGKHVMSEKPLATSVADASAMVKLAAKKHLSLTVDHMMVYNAFNQLTRKYIANGKLGNIGDSCFHMEFLFGATPEEAATWRCNNVDEMGGPIGDVASHCIYMAEFVFNSKIKQVQAVYLPKTLPIKAEDGAYIRFTLENGQTGSFKVAFCENRGGGIGTASSVGYEIYGDTAVLRSYGTLSQRSGSQDDHLMRLELESSSGIKSLRPRKFPNIYQQVIIRHAQSIIDGKPLNAEDGLRNLRACLAIHKSARNGGKTYMVK